MYIVLKVTTNKRILLWEREVLVCRVYMLINKFIFKSCPAHKSDINEEKKITKI